MDLTIDLPSEAEGSTVKPTTPPAKAKQASPATAPAKAKPATTKRSTKPSRSRSTSSSTRPASKRTKKADSTRRVRYVSRRTDRLRDLILGPNRKQVICPLCGFNSSTPHRNEAHISQHLMKYFCDECETTGGDREVVASHQGEDCEGRVYEVDEASFPTFRRETRTPVANFGDLSPMTDGRMAVYTDKLDAIERHEERARQSHKRIPMCMDFRSSHARKPTATPAPAPQAAAAAKPTPVKARLGVPAATFACQDVRRIENPNLERVIFNAGTNNAIPAVTVHTVAQLDDAPVLSSRPGTLPDQDSLDGTKWVPRADHDAALLQHETTLYEIMCWMVAAKPSRREVTNRLDDQVETLRKERRRQQ